MLAKPCRGCAISKLRPEHRIIPAHRVEDYRLLSDASGSKSLSPKVKNMLIFTIFHPATFMGKPTRGTATLVFSLAGFTTSAPSVERQ